MPFSNHLSGGLVEAACSRKIISFFKSVLFLSCCTPWILNAQNTQTTSRVPFLRWKVPFILNLPDTTDLLPFFVTGVGEGGIQSTINIFTISFVLACRVTSRLIGFWTEVSQNKDWSASRPRPRLQNSTTSIWHKEERRARVDSRTQNPVVLLHRPVSPWSLCRKTLSFAAQGRKRERGGRRDWRRNCSKLAGSGRGINPVCHIKDRKESISELTLMIRGIKCSWQEGKWQWWAQKGIQARSMLEERKTRPSIAAGSERLCLPRSQSLPVPPALPLSSWLRCPPCSVAETCRWLAFPDVSQLDAQRVVSLCWAWRSPWRESS